MNYMIDNAMQQQNQVNSIRQLFYECLNISPITVRKYIDLDVL